jgi:hypothetical protein
MARAIAIVAVLLVALLLVGKCGGSEQPSQPLLDDGLGDNVAADEGTGDRAATAGQRAGEATPPAAEGEPISVPSDPRASYSLLRWSRLGNGNLQAVTRREGPSGTSYARREIDCGAMTFRYLGEGGTLEESLADGPNPGRMAELTNQSISSYVSQFVCRKAGR